MKNKQAYILLIASLLLSTGIIRTSSVNNVPFCVESAGCHFGMEPKGSITMHQYGYPLIYKEISTFNPTNFDANTANYAGYAEANQQQLTIVNILINLLFWFGLLKLITNLLPTKATISKHDS